MTRTRAGACSPRPDPRTPQHVGARSHANPYREIATPDENSERAPCSASVVASVRARVVYGMPLTGRLQQRCCSAKCRAAKSPRNRKDELARLEEQVARRLTRLRTLQGKP